MKSWPKMLFWMTAAYLAQISFGVAQVAKNPNKAPTASIEGDQTLEDLALSLYQDEDAADEIRAINKLSPGAQPKPGEKITLPGEDRQPAISALNMASQAVKKAELEGAKEYVPVEYSTAVESLNKAQNSCRHANYTLCQKFADETWALARMAEKESHKRRSDTNRFAVSVDSKGTTRVEVSEGGDVQVSAQNKTMTVKRGQGIKVAPGTAPKEVRKFLDPPKQVLPYSGSKLLTRSIQFHWKPIGGAVKYVLLIAKDAMGRQAVRQITTAKTFYLLRSNLPDGKYFWFLRTVDSLGLVGASSPAKSFILSTNKSPGVEIEKSKKDKHRGKGP